MWFCSDAGSAGSLASSVPFPSCRVEMRKKRDFQWVLDVSGAGAGSLSFFFWKQISVPLLWWWAVKNFTTLETLSLKKSYHHSGPSPVRPNELWTRLDN